MTERRAARVDARGAARFPIAPMPGLPAVEPMPEVIADRPLFGGSATRAPRLRGWGRGPVAGLPVPIDGTRTETRPLTVYHVIDVSPSNAWTDPEAARFKDFAYVSRSWAARHVPDDDFVQVLFDSQAVIYPPCRPRDVPRDGWASRPTPTAGGTAFAPPARAVALHAAQHPDRAVLAIVYSDGLGDDVAEADRVLVDAGIPGVLIPYGPDFPWVSAGWNYTSFRLAAHVDDRRRAIAQTVALAILQATGHQRSA